mmetsp:Transcript_106589/g.343927  ORF Transcript_106589/g.343927 Transcript_106589/m.343927 type:complete len:332 (-) Transcript_106589:876-1871(-)
MGAVLPFCVLRQPSRRACLLLPFLDSVPSALRLHEVACLVHLSERVLQVVHLLLDDILAIACPRQPRLARQDIQHLVPPDLAHQVGMRGLFEGQPGPLALFPQQPRHRVLGCGAVLLQALVHEELFQDVPVGSVCIDHVDDVLQEQVLGRHVRLPVALQLDGLSVRRQVTRAMLEEEVCELGPLVPIELLGTLQYQVHACLDPLLGATPDLVLHILDVVDIVEAIAHPQHAAANAVELLVKVDVLVEKSRIDGGEAAEAVDREVEYDEEGDLDPGQAQAQGVDDAVDLEPREGAPRSVEEPNALEPPCPCAALGIEELHSLLAHPCWDRLQ